MEPPVLDVHPQHEAAHSWKDFFLHIATICIGLLIAIGLEQTVEAVHHRHQRHELEQQLRAETLRNLNIALVNIDDYTKAVDEANEQYTELMNAAHDHRVPQALRFPVPAAVVKPASAVWIVAQQSATLALLPPAISQRYVRVYSVADQATSCLLENNELSQKLSAALRPALTAAGLKTGITLSGASYDLSRMTVDQLRIYSECLAEMISKEGYCRSRNKLLYGIEWSAWHGTTSDEENLRIALDASHTKGGSAAIVAKYPLPEEVMHTIQLEEGQ